MKIISELNFTKVVLAAILQCHQYPDEDIQKVVQLIQRAYNDDEDVDLTTVQLWRLYQKTDPDKLKGTEYESMSWMIEETLGEATENCQFDEGIRLTDTITLHINDLSNLQGCICKAEDDEKELFFLIKNMERTGKESFLLKLVEDAFFKIYKEVILQKGLVFYHERSWQKDPIMTIYCKVDDNPIYKLPVYVPLDYFIELPS